MITDAISELEGNIVTLGTFLGEDLSNRILVLKVGDVPEERLVDKMKELDTRILDVRTAEAP
jgi:uncharacterized protein with ACT and thioredoxin-like domain